jgi:hypothetical protein
MLDFMTGDNNNQKFLKNVATVSVLISVIYMRLFTKVYCTQDLDASSIKSFNWTAPEVEPHAAVYFLMFTNGSGIIFVCKFLLELLT